MPSSAVFYIQVSLTASTVFSLALQKSYNSCEKQRDQLPHLALHVPGKVGLVLDDSRDTVVQPVGHAARRFNVELVLADARGLSARISSINKTRECENKHSRFPSQCSKQPCGSMIIPGEGAVKELETMAASRKAMGSLILMQLGATNRGTPYPTRVQSFELKIVKP